MPLSRAAIKTLVVFGVNNVSYDTFNKDPKTEEEFNLLTFSNANQSLTWAAFQEEYAKSKEKVAVNDIRNYRSRLLQKSDWIVQPDVIHTIQNIQEWLTYRQQLRDLPETMTEYVWLTDDILNFQAMNIPKPPPVIRI